MKKEKFLTVYAVFDDKTQQKLKVLQDEVIKSAENGTQTMGIPFHISLGSFSLDKKEWLIQKIEDVCLYFDKFDIYNKVLFVEPKVNDELKNLQSHFDDNYADGFPWHAHATIFCGEEQEVAAAKEKLQATFSPFMATVVSLELGEFFPTKILFTKTF